MCPTSETAGQTFLKALFAEYTANHNEAVFLSALQIENMYPGGQLWADIPGFPSYVTATRLRPDLVEFYLGRYYYWKVKPNSAYGAYTGNLQLLAYDLCFAGIGTRGGPLGEEWVPDMATVGGLFVHDSGVAGLIYYDKNQGELVTQAQAEADEEVPDGFVVVIPVEVVVM